MKAERQHPWQIYVHAKAKSFDFKIKATSIFPNSKFSPFPIKFNLNVKLCPSLLQSKKSEPYFPVPRKGKSMKSKFLRFLGKFRPRPSKNKATASNQSSNLEGPQAHFPVDQSTHSSYEESMCISSIVIGFIALLSKSISQKDYKAIILCSLIILLFLSLIMKKVISRRKRNAMFIVIVAMVGCAIGVYLSNISKISGGYFSDCVWKSCVELCSYFAQVIHSSFTQDVGAHGGTTIRVS